MNGAQWVVHALRAQGVQTVFGYPGGAIMPVYDALYDGGVEHLLCRHEQGAAMAAIGYARATGKTGVCIATSGPGATNLITGLADALLDSVPVVAITGQVASPFIGTDAFQEVDVLGMSLSCTKHSFLVQSLEELPRIMAEAFAVANSGRPGPVLVDIPKDIQLASGTLEPYFTTVENVEDFPHADVEQARKMLAQAQKPILYVGGGVGMAQSVRPSRSTARAATRCAISSRSSRTSTAASTCCSASSTAGAISSRARSATTAGVSTPVKPSACTADPTSPSDCATAW